MKTYSWTRFFAPRDARLVSDDGFLADPEGPYGKAANPELRTADDVSAYPCLVLLGERGIGKSQALRSLYQVEPKGQRALFVDLGGIASESGLRTRLHEHETFVAWKRDGGRLYLYLDSLDECLLRMERLQKHLIEELQVLPHEELRLRIACRTGYWPTLLEKSFRESLGPDFGVFEVTPLRRRDVAVAASDEGIDAAFLSDVISTQAVSFATNPVTLQMLLERYRLDGQLPRSAWQLYELGCKALCEEPPDRRGLGLPCLLGTEQRLDLASRLAAVTMLSGRSIVVLGETTGSDPDTEVSVTALARGSESLAGGLPVTISEDLVREVLATGLFNAKGENRVGWAQLAYAHFLCARYLLRTTIESRQVFRLLSATDPDHPGSIVPQLRGIAAWLASTKPEYFEAVIDSDPDVLLSLVGVTFTTEQKRRIAAAYIDRIERRLLKPARFEGRRRFELLRDPALGHLLRPIVVNRSLSDLSRRVAMEMGLSTGAADLVSDALRIALDGSEERYLRQAAVELVGDLGDEASRLSLAPLLKLDRDGDPDDQFRGLVLFALWPSSLSCRDLLEALVPPHRPNFYGRYQAFLAREPIRSMDSADVPVALAWVERMLRSGMTSALERLVDSVVVAAWRSCTTPEAEAALAAFLEKVLLRRELLHGRSFGKRLSSLMEEDRELRRRLASRLIQAMAPSEFWRLAVSEPRLVTSFDVSWLLEQIQGCEEGRRDSLVGLLSRVFDPKIPDQLEAVLVAEGSIPGLRAALAWSIGPVPLGSPLADAMKEEHLRATAPPPPDDRQAEPSLESRLREVLATAAEIKVGAFPAAMQLISEEEGTEPFYGRLIFDLLELKKWGSLGPDLQGAIALAARGTLIDADPRQDLWLGKRSAPSMAWTYLAALNLAATRGLVTAELWKKWAPITVGLPFYGPGSSEALSALRRQALESAPGEMYAAIETLLTEAHQEGGAADFDARVGSIWDGKVTDFVLHALRSASGGGRITGLLEALFKNDAAAAAKYCLETIEMETVGARLSLDGEVSAALLLATRAREHWNTIWPFLEASDSACETVLRKAREAVWWTGRSFYEGLDAAQIGRVYRRLLAIVPYSGDVQHTGVFTPSVRDELQDLRDELLRVLSKRGDRLALKEFEAIRDEHPELGFLTYYALEARELLLDRSWVALDPGELAELFADPGKRIVRTASELGAVILEAFESIETAMHCQTPDVDCIWNDDGRGRRWPKGEESLSNYLANRLVERLGKWRPLVLHREVQIRGGLTGVEKTDIFVDAVGDTLGSGSSKVSLVIEVKGCWHPDLFGAMDSQLVRGYMRTAALAHGIYVVFWFDTAEWDKADRKRRVKVRQMELKELRDVLIGQAQSLSVAGSVVRSHVFDGSLRCEAASPSRVARRAKQRAVPAKPPTTRRNAKKRASKGTGKAGTRRK